ncbi:MAG: hypothetical protein ACPGQS_05275 [Bradymonadia bacterium]
MNKHLCVTRKEPLYPHSSTFLIRLEDGGDVRAPGGAVTLELCGSWSHEGECRYPHFTSANNEGAEVRITVDFSAPTAEIPQITERIKNAIRRGTLVGPDGNVTTWRVVQ